MDAHEMQSGDNRARAVLLDRETAVVERLRKSYPAGVIRPETGREDYGADVRKRQDLRRVGLERPRRRHLGSLYRCGGTCLADELADIGKPRVAKRDRRGQVGGKVGSAVGDANEMTQQLDALRLQRSEVQVVTAHPSAHLRVGQEPRLWAREVAQTHIKEGGFA